MPGGSHPVWLLECYAYPLPLARMVSRPPPVLSGCSTGLNGSKNGRQAPRKTVTRRLAGLMAQLAMRSNFRMNSVLPVSPMFVEEFGLILE
ncbi:MAG: hypothetical protein R3B74_00535 [Nitrospirales bacterium]|nr:hypothetical protein [Nitrospirales bacterium]